MRHPPLQPRSQRPPVEGEFERYIWALKDIEVIERAEEQKTEDTFDPSQPRDPDGKWSGVGGGEGDDELGSMALGGAERFMTASTRKVDALRGGMRDIPFKQRQALDMYTESSTAAGFNRHARIGGSGPVTEEIRHLDTLVNSHQLPHDVTVYRTVGWTRKQDIMNHMGDTFSDPGFMSTTLDQSKVTGKPGTYIEIQVPKGSRAFPVGSLSNYQEEAEILFPRDSKLQLISSNEVGNTTRIVARLLS